MANQYRPPQWAKPAMVSITAPAGSGSVADTNASLTKNSAGIYTLSTKQTVATAYVFDAVLGLDHEQTLVKTHHPVQTGSSVSSHAYIEPARVSMYVLMSDVVGQYTLTNQTSPPYIQTWSGSPSKSVSAYRQLLKLQAARVPLVVTTRLRTYQNMLILKIAPHEDSKTLTGARFTVEFEQLFVANLQANPSSARPNDTDSTGLGATSTQPPSDSVNSQFAVHAFTPGDGSTVALPPDLNNGTIPAISDGVPGYLSQPTGPYGVVNFTPQYPNSVSAVNVPGAGDYSSVNTNSLQQLPGVGQ